MRIQEPFIFDPPPTNYWFVITYIVASILVILQITFTLIGWRKRNDVQKVRNWLALQFLTSFLTYLLGESFYYIYSAKMFSEIAEQGAICGSGCQFVAYSDLAWIKGIFNVAACAGVALTILTWAFKRPQSTVS
jgi:hypothetical protein